jgi:hypothetical protein
VPTGAAPMYLNPMDPKNATDPMDPTRTHPKNPTECVVCVAYLCGVSVWRICVATASEKLPPLPSKGEACVAFNPRKRPPSK